MKQLARFAAKISGVSNAKIGTRFKSIMRNIKGMAFSARPFKRMISKAAEIGIFSVHGNF
ncbi:hypothetical protein NCCP133_26350 [Cytobacillus sp. NCCP-133]|nr:hypothetical protein NCCP133_26350 [Cytobacillus sp. NCCP-133]